MDTVDKSTQTKQPMSKDSSTFIRLNGFTLRKTTDMNTGKIADLSWCIRDNYPRLVLNTDVKAEWNFNNIITAPFDYVSLISSLDIFLSMLDKGEEDSLKIACKNVKYITENGVSKKTDEKVIQGEVILGISSKGIVYISCTKQGSEKIAFPIMFDKDWFTIYKSNSEVVDTKILSITFAKNYIKTLKSVLEGFAKDAATTTTKAFTRPNNTYPKSNNYNKGNFNNGYYKKENNFNQNKNVTSTEPTSLEPVPVTPDVTPNKEVVTTTVSEAKVEVKLEDTPAMVVDTTPVVTQEPKQETKTDELSEFLG